MESIAISNIRYLYNTGELCLNPLTILVGANSSGKSTFLRTFPLIRQSIESKTTGPILWYGTYVDFGNFKTSLNKFSNNEKIDIEFKFKANSGDRYGYREISKNIAIKLKLTIIEDRKKESSFLEEMTFNVNSNEIKLIFDIENDKKTLQINGIEYSQVLNELVFINKNIIPNVISKNRNYYLYNNINVYGSALRDLVVKNMKKNLDNRVIDETVLKIFHDFAALSTDEELLTSMKDIQSPATWVNKVKKWDINNESFKELKNLKIASNLIKLIGLSEDYVNIFFKNVHYIAPLRATAERYYRVQNLAVDEVDFRGQNMPMFLKNLTDTERNRFSEWTKEYFGFNVVAKHSSGHISLIVNETNSEATFNLTDMGFGFSQVLPILTQLWVLVNKPQKNKYLTRSNIPITFAIEQPELHLHPRLQAKLADVFAAVIKYAKSNSIDLKLLIETHSETIINRIGQLISKDKFDNNHVSVIIFEKNKDNQTDIAISTYDQEGYLSNWPYGFFSSDED